MGVLGIMLMSGKDNFRLDRIQTFFDPWKDELGTGYQVIQSLYAIGSGGLFRSRTSEKVNKNIYTYQNHIMTLYLL